MTETKLPEKESYALDEWKNCLDETRFAMSRYMQMLAIYVAFAGLLFREMFAAQDFPMVVMWASTATVLNALVVYAAHWFRRMAHHSLDRATVLAKHFNFQPPHPMMWGYWLGLLMVASAQLGALGFFVWRFLERNGV